jgi:hypothetical protein
MGRVIANEAEFQTLMEEVDSELRAEGHDLGQSARIAEGEGLPKIDSTILKAAQCDASVRYDDSDKQMEPVLAANTAAVVIACVATSQLAGGPSFKI